MTGLHSRCENDGTEMSPPLPEHPAPAVSMEDIMAALKRSLRGDKLLAVVETADPEAEDAVVPDAEDQFVLGDLYQRGDKAGPDYEKASAWYRRAAEQGHAEAQLNLGLMYSRGQGFRGNYAEAVMWLRMAAKQGLSDAQYCLGLHCGGGHGTPPSWAEAMEWFRKAADQGHDGAQLWLGYAYRDGDLSVPRNDGDAVKWFRLASEAGNAEAQFSLGGMYALGRGVTPERVNRRETPRVGV